MDVVNELAAQLKRLAGEVFDHYPVDSLADQRV
jgi:hypothetical protein